MKPAQLAAVYAQFLLPSYAFSKVNFEGSCVYKDCKCSYINAFKFNDIDQVILRHYYFLIIHDTSPIYILYT